MSQANAFHADMKEALAILRPPSKPLPAGACDVHAHVFGPFDKFPLVAERRYDPPLSPYEEYIAMLDRVGTSNGVLVHAGAHGYDNSATLDALARAKGRLRGIAVVPPETGDATFEQMNHAGMRGIRFTEMGQPAAPLTPGMLGFAELKKMAPRLKELGWHAQIWAKGDVIAENAAMLRSLNIPVVFDHMGQFDVTRGPADKNFQTLIGLLKEGGFWLKVTAFRNSQALPDMADVRPFHEALVAAAPDRLVWGSDWPFIGMGGQLPNVGHLLDTLAQWSGEAAFRRILVDNPRALYGF
jgi:predicted TIM-barrel fold metal-dependent hydrolase